MKRSSDAGNGAVAGGCPFDFQLARGANRVLLALADDRDVVAAAHHLHEAGNVLDRRFVDRLRASRRRPAAARCARAACRALSCPRPSVCVPSTFAGMSSRRGDLPTFFIACTGLSGACAGGGVDVPAGERDVELLPADQLAVRDAAFGGIAAVGADDAVADRERRDRHAEMRRAISSSTRRASAATRRIG